MPETMPERGFVLLFRLAMAWVFLYAASQQVGNASFSAAGFLSHAKTFHDLFAPLADPSIAPIVTALVAFGHLLIGLSLLLGLMVRLSASLGALMFVAYWLGNIDWPYVENKFNLIIDYHLVYAAICLYLAVRQAGRVLGLDAWAARQPVVQGNAVLRALVA